MIKNIKLLVINLLLVIYSFNAFSQAGTLDATFSSDGKAMFDLGDSHDVANALITLPDSTTILGGATILTSSFDGFIMRILENGEQDMNFGNNGFVKLNYGLETYVYSLALTPDGKILVAGATYLTYQNAEMFVSRYYPDGTLDETFGTDGLFLSDYSTVVEICYAMAIQDNGKIVIGGSTSLGGFSQLLFMRLNANGTLDTSFGTDGYTEINASAQDEQIDDLDFMSNGDIVGVGNGYISNPLWGEQAFVVKINSNGIPVSGFGTNGVLIPAVITTYSIAKGVAILNDSILVTGYQNNGGGGRDLFLTKLNASGVADPAFATNGISFVNVNYWNIGYSVMLEGDNKIIVAGSAGLGGIGDSEFFLLRYLADGSLDPTFNSVGYVTTNFRSDWDEAYGLGMQPDGKLVLAGISGGLTNSGENKIPMARYLNDYSPFHAGFDATPNPVCEGGTVDFTNTSGGDIISYEWSFDGGSPSTSTMKNPQITYNTVGNYDVQLIITDLDSNKDTLLKANYISVIATPAQANQPVGEAEVCTGSSIEYSTNEVLYAQNYGWEITPSGAGVLTANMNSATLEVSDTWTGGFTIRVRANNMCGDGEWSEDLTGTVHKTPDPYDLIGGGEICEGGPGLEIGLIDSESGVDYKLYKNEVATGNIVAGTGEAISFGLITEAGNYTVLGYTQYCSTAQYGEASIIIALLPVQLTTPAGTTEVCNNTENEYTTTGAQGTDNVVWDLTPENAGTISADGMSAIIMWNSSFEGDATLTVYAENSCGTGPVSVPLEILVMASPTPEVTGDDLVCKEEVSVYSTIANAGSTYGWEVIGGTITTGEGTHEVTITWSNTPGMAYAIVNESLELGCSAVDTLAVTIDDCTGIEDNFTVSEVKVYPNPTYSNLNLEFAAGIGENVMISVYNSMGQLIQQQHEIALGQKQTSILNVGQLPKGMYVVTVKTAEKQIWKGKFEKN